MQLRIFRQHSDVSLWTTFHPVNLCMFGVLHCTFNCQGDVSKGNQKFVPSGIDAMNTQPPFFDKGSPTLELSSAKLLIIMLSCMLFFFGFVLFYMNLQTCTYIMKHNRHEFTRKPECSHVSLFLIPKCTCLMISSFHYPHLYTNL